LLDTKTILHHHHGIHTNNVAPDHHTNFQSLTIESEEKEFYEYKAILNINEKNKTCTEEERNHQEKQEIKNLEGTTKEPPE